MYNEKNKKIELAAGCFTVIVLSFIMPLIYFASGCLTGLVLKWIVGDAVTNGLNLLFNTTRFTADMLPIVCGALGVVGSFFKNSNASTRS